MIRLAPWEVMMRPPDTSGASVIARLAAARPRGVPLTALWVAIVVAELVALRPVLWDREAPVQAIEVVLTLVGGSFAACGLIAWRRRPDSWAPTTATAPTSTTSCSPKIGRASCRERV